MDPLIGRKEAARILGISLATLDSARQNGEISYVQYTKNGKIYFTETNLQAYIAKNTHQSLPRTHKHTFRTPRKHRL